MCAAAVAGTVRVRMGGLRTRFGCRDTDKRSRGDIANGFGRHLIFKDVFSSPISNITFHTVFHDMDSRTYSESSRSRVLPLPLPHLLLAPHLSSMSLYEQYHAHCSRLYYELDIISSQPSQFSSTIHSSLCTVKRDRGMRTQSVSVWEEMLRDM